MDEVNHEVKVPHDRVHQQLVMHALPVQIADRACVCIAIIIIDLHQLTFLHRRDSSRTFCQVCSPSKSFSKKKECGPAPAEQNAYRCLQRLQMKEKSVVRQLPDCFAYLSPIQERWY